MFTGRIVTRLPPSVSREVGRVIQRYALLEHRFFILIYGLLRIDQKLGRVAVREARGKDLVDVVRILMEAHGQIPLKPWWQKLHKKMESAATQRDLLAHGIWVRHPTTKQIFLRVTRGNWQPDGAQGKVSRKIKPEGVPFGPTESRAALAVIREISEMQMVLRREVDAWLKASRKKSQPQPPRRPLRQPRSTSTPNTPPPPSQA